MQPLFKNHIDAKMCHINTLYYIGTSYIVTNMELLK